MTRADAAAVWRRRAFGLVPVLIALLWVAGTAELHGHRLSGLDWAVLAAAGAALQILAKRALRPRPLPALPDGVRPTVVAALAAGIFALLAALFGGVAEVLLADRFPATASPLLCALWHGACAGGAGYVSLLPRLQAAARARAAR